ncbi:MAG: hypothetical protein FWE01_01165 [Firmicutes bacterium]|nr:hypothetical protein [Bacillota bacterium]
MSAFLYPVTAFDDPEYDEYYPEDADLYREEGLGLLGSNRRGSFPQVETKETSAYIRDYDVDPDGWGNL